jgi:hypothetical protein
LKRLVLTLALFVVAGCAAILGADFDAHLVTTPIGDDGGDAAAADAPAGCAHARAPANTAQGQNKGGTVEAWFAVYSIDYGDGDGKPDAADFAELGYDVDRTCTSYGEPPICLQGGKAAPDGKDGRDNAAGRLFFEVKSLYQILTGGIGSSADTANIQQGNESILFHLTGYDGLPDDDQVTVEWYSAAPFPNDKLLPDGGKPVPRWDGTDEWPLRADGPDAGLGPLAVDPAAYVTANVLVASLPRGTKILGGSIDLNLDGVFFTATLTRALDGLEMKDGNLAGVWRAQQVFAGMAPFFEKNGRCSDSQIYQDIKQLVCNALDVSSAGVPLPTEPCDSLSFGMAFTAKPVKPPAGTANASVPPNICPPATDPRNDTCIKDGG